MDPLLGRIETLEQHALNSRSKPRPLPAGSGAGAGSPVASWC